MNGEQSHLRRPIPLIWQLFIFVASIAVLLVLGISLLMPIPPEVRRVLFVADFGICMVFMADFFALLYLHKDRKRYLLTWGWLDFLSSIPMLDMFRWARIARIIRLLRLYRGLRGSAGILRRLFADRQEATLIAIILTLLFVTIFCSVAILVAEEGSGSNIDTAENAIWWTLTTMTTVGYGDLAPVTTLGKVVAVAAMFSGIGVFGAFTALVASLLVQPRRDTEAAKEILERLETIEQALRGSKINPPSESGTKQGAQSVSGGV